MRHWSVLGFTNELRGHRHGSEKPRSSILQNRAYDLSTRLWGRERANGARGTHHRIILKFRIFSSDRKVSPTPIYELPATRPMRCIIDGKVRMPLPTIVLSIWI